MDRTGQEPVVSATAASRAGEPAGDPRPAGAAPADSGLVARGDFAALSSLTSPPSWAATTSAAGPRRRPHPVRLGRARLPRLRLRHRHYLPGSPPSGGHAGDQGPADKLLHICNALGYLEPVGQLATMLADACPDPLDTVFFGNSGTEAVEGALKLARRVTGRPGIIAFREPSTAEPSAPHRSRARASTTGSATSRCCRRST